MDKNNKLPLVIILLIGIIFIGPKLGVFDITGNNFYVRPLTTGTYGTGDGTSYDNAWNGFMNITFGPGGVQAGDTLYICGSHINQKSLQKTINISVSGTAGSPITIRMDCPGDTGTVWGFYNLSRTWTLLGDDIYTNNVNMYYYDDYIEYRSDSDYNVLVETTNAGMLQGATGASYYDGGKANGGTLYIRLSDRSDPNKKTILANVLGGYFFTMDNVQYINFYKCNFNGFALRSYGVSNIQFDSCNLKYAEKQAGTARNLIELRDGASNIVIKNSEFAYGCSALYTISPGIYDNILLQNNIVHDIAIGQWGDYACDGHAFGLQDISNSIVIGNTIWNTGEAISFWSGTYEMKNNLVKDNFIKDIYMLNRTFGHGIAISGNQVSAIPGKRTGFKVYNNIIMNTGIPTPGYSVTGGGDGIHTNNPDYMEIYNNVIYNPLGRGIWTYNSYYGLNGAIYNNIVVNPGTQYIYMNGNTSEAWNLVVDNNLYSPYPATDTSKFTFTKETTHDANSVFADPQFISPSPMTATDFNLQSTSPARGAGNPITGNLDIGAYIYGGSLPPSSSYVKFRTTDLTYALGSAVGYTGIQGSILTPAGSDSIAIAHSGTCATKIPTDPNCGYGTWGTPTLILSNLPGGYVSGGANPSLWFVQAGSVGVYCICDDDGTNYQVSKYYDIDSDASKVSTSATSITPSMEVLFSSSSPPVSGSRSGGYYYNAPTASCSWSCTDWTACSGETQTRNCTNINFCGESTKPSETQSCTNIENNLSKNLDSSTIIIIVIIVLFYLIKTKKIKF